MALNMMIAHRGYSAIYPENTILAFDKARELGCVGIELDVVLSSDGVPFVMHDNTLDRTTDGTGYCYNASWSYLQTLDAGSWKGVQFTGEGIPSLEEVLDKYKGRNVCLFIELESNANYVNLPSIVANLIATKGMETQCRVMSFNFDDVDAAKTANTNLITGLIGYSAVSFATAISRALAGGHKFLNWEYSDANLTQAQINTIHQNGLKLYVWTVNTSVAMQNMINLSVDGIMSDYADYMIEMLDSNYIEQIKFNDDWYKIPVKGYDGIDWLEATPRQWHIDEYWAAPEIKIFR